MLRMRLSVAWLGVLAVVAGCSSGGGTTDSGGTDVVAMEAAMHDAAAVDAPAPIEAGTICLNDTQCSDGLYCNGVEHCAPHGAGADANGCIHGAAPCMATQMCVEATQMCVAADCAAHPDADGDGHHAIACGGDDCDDTDPHRFPGNPEVCAYDATTMTRTDPTHDEDCNPATFSSPTSNDGDHDGDGYVDRACCNVDSMGTNNCGNDCADLANVAGVPASFMTSVGPALIHPTAVEVCNGVDDNCNGTIDEGLATALYYHDCDGDTYGVTGMPGIMSCSGQVQICMGHLGVSNNTDCDDTRTAVHPGAMEVCDGIDDDCNPATVDPTVTCYADADADGYRSTSVTMQMCSCGAGWLTSTSPIDCYDGNANARPGQTAFFPMNRGDGNFDYDCDGSQTEEWTTSFYTNCGGATGCGVDSEIIGWYANMCTGSPIPACGATGNYATSTSPFTGPTTCVFQRPPFCAYCEPMTGRGTVPRTQACR